MHYLLGLGKAGIGAFYHLFQAQSKSKDLDLSPAQSGLDLGLARAAWPLNSPMNH